MVPSVTALLLLPVTSRFPLLPSKVLYQENPDPCGVVLLRRRAVWVRTAHSPLVYLMSMCDWGLGSAMTLRTKIK